jgi:hypothetical protein
MANKDGDLKVWWTPQVPMEPFEIPVSTVEDAAKLLSVLSEYDAFQLIQNVKGDYCNAGGLMIFEDGEWCDWYDDETGDDRPGDFFPQPSLGWCAVLLDEEADNGK